MPNILRSLRGLTPFIGVRCRLRSDLPSRPASDDNLGRLKPSSAIKNEKPLAKQCCQDQLLTG